MTDYFDQIQSEEELENAIDFIFKQVSLGDKLEKTVIQPLMEKELNPKEQKVLSLYFKGNDYQSIAKNTQFTQKEVKLFIESSKYKLKKEIWTSYMKIKK